MTLLKRLKDVDKEETERIQEPEEREDCVLPSSGHDRVMASMISVIYTKPIPDLSSNIKT